MLVSEQETTGVSNLMISAHNSTLIINVLNLHFNFCQKHHHLYLCT
jgi:hypothetical protein